MVDPVGARLHDFALLTCPNGMGDHRSVIFSVAYPLVRCLLGCLMMLARREVSKDAELLVLRHENEVLRRHADRIHYQPADRLWLAALSRLIPRHRWSEVFAVTPATLLAWHLWLPRIPYGQIIGVLPTCGGVCRSSMIASRVPALRVPSRRPDTRGYVRENGRQLFANLDRDHGLGDPQKAWHRSRAPA